MKNKLILLFSIFLCRHSFAQQTGQRIFSGEIQEISFIKYPPKVFIKPILNSQVEAKCIYPEDLMLSIMSCNNANWEIYHTVGGKEKADIKDAAHYSAVKKVDKNKNYFELKHKLEFLIADIPTAIVKYYLITEQNPSPIAGVVTMQQYNGRWQKCSMKMFSKLSLLSLRIKSEELEHLINGNENTIFLKELKKKINPNGIFNFDQLSIEFDTWDSEESKENTAYKNYFKDPNSIL